MSERVRPYGSWPSPITAASLVEQAVSLGQVEVDGERVYWLEGRPSEGGRQRGGAFELLGRAQTRLDRLRELDFVRGGEQLVLADLLEVLPHQVLHEVGVAATRHSLTPG